MSILLDRTTPVLVQGITGKIGSFHAKEMREYGTNVVGGVTPGKGGTTQDGLPVFDTMKEAVEKTGATATIVFVPPPFAADSIMEAADANIRLCVVGIVGRSGTLGYEAAAQMMELGIGVSTSVGIGGDPINGSSFKDILELFEADPETHAVVMIGEIGGPQEAEAAEYIRDHMTKPVIAYVAGLSAPKGRKMGHAGAIISAFGEGASEKVELLRDVGVAIAPTPAEIGSTAQKVLKAA